MVRPAGDVTWTASGLGSLPNHTGMDTVNLPLTGVSVPVIRGVSVPVIRGVSVPVVRGVRVPVIRGVSVSVIRGCEMR